MMPTNSRRRQGGISMGLAALLCAVVAGPGHAAPARDATGDVAGAGPAQYVVACHCARAVDKQRVAGAIRRTGGTVLYIHRESQSLTAAAPAGRGASRFAARLKRIPGVIGVERTGVSHPSSTG